MKILKLTNISNFDVSVAMTDGNLVNVPSGAVIEDVDVVNTESLKGMVQIVQELKEVPKPTGMHYLKG